MKDTLGKPTNLPGIKKTQLPHRKALIPKSRIFTFHGTAAVDLYYANVQNPRQFNENQYARFYIDPTISVMGLPFATRIFLTTENNNFFNSNSVSVKFDAQAYRRQLMEKYRKQYEEERRKLGSSNTDIYNTDKLLAKQKDELAREQKKLEVSDKMMEKELEKMRKSAIQKASDSTNRLTDQQKTNPYDSAMIYGHSANSRIQLYRDSMSEIRAKQMERIEKLKNTISQAQQHRDSMKGQAEHYKAQADKYSKLMKDPTAVPDNTKNSAQDSLDKSLGRYKPRVSDIRQFDVGLFYADQTELTTMGLPVKGLNLLVNPGKLLLGIGGGRTISSFNSISQSRQAFDRNAATITLGYQLGHRSKITWHGGGIWDEKEKVNRKSNFYSSIVAEQQFRQLQVKAEAAYSKFQSHNGNIETVNNQSIERSYIQYRLSDHIAHKVRAQYEFRGNSTFSGSYSRVPLNYMTLGNPYMRRDYMEYEAMYKQKFFKNKVQSEVFYKENRNNLSGFETYTTKAKGYGISLQTNFTTLPNLSLTYLPYSMGNNHPDSALQTRSQFSVVNAVLSYSLFRSKWMWSSLFMYSQSEAELAPGELSGNILLSSNQTLDYGGKINLNFTCNASRFQYTSDTLNFNQCKLILLFKPGKAIQPQIGGDYVLYKNGASKSTLLAGCNFRIKKTFSFRFSYSFSHLYKIWGFEEKYAHQAKGALMFSW